jgi:hypothetical protein
LLKSYPAKELRIPTIATTHSDGSRPAVPIDRDQCGAMTGIADCCARAASCHALVITIHLMKSRRRIAFSKAHECADYRLQGRDHSRDLPPAKWGSGVSLHGSSPKPPMSALGQQRTSRAEIAMSALPPKADIWQQPFDVGFGPQADIGSLQS